MVITTAQLHLTKPELWYCAGPNYACDMLEICDGENLWQWSWLEIRHLLSVMDLVRKGVQLHPQLNMYLKSILGVLLLLYRLNITAAHLIF